MKTIGIIIPSLNRVVEDDFHARLPSEWRIVSTRVPFDGGGAAELARMNEHATAAARLLSDARPDVIVYACTSATFLGSAAEERVRGNLQDVAGSDVCVVTTSAAVVCALNEVASGRRIAVATPYTDDLNSLEVDYLRAAGFEVVDLASMQLADAFDASVQGPDDIRETVERLDTSSADAIFLSCTNLRALELVDELEMSTGLPVVTSNQAMLWATLQAEPVLEIPTLLGRLLRPAPWSASDRR